MQSSKPSLFTRHDTFFGVCEALGQDFGFNANYVRLLVAVGLLLNPMVTIAAYLGAGVVIAVSRRIFPSRVAEVHQFATQTTAANALRGDNDEAAVDLATAA